MQIVVIRDRHPVSVLHFLKEVYHFVLGDQRLKIEFIHEVHRHCGQVVLSADFSDCIENIKVTLVCHREDIQMLKNQICQLRQGCDAAENRDH